MAENGRDWKQELKRIVDFLNANDEHASALWSVLSALRGPDWSSDESEATKHATTAVIRHAIGLRSCLLGLTINGDESGYAHSRYEATTNTFDTCHFMSHARTAFVQLGLWWARQNLGEAGDALKTPSQPLLVTRRLAKSQSVI